MNADDPRHGTYAGYGAGCRSRETCSNQSPDTCVDAERRYQNRYNRDRAYGRPRKVPSIGSVRRLQALMAVGWPGHYLAERLGMRQTNLPTHLKFPTIRTERAERLKALYEELLATDAVGPSDRTRRHAEMHGFLPPEAWADTDMDDPDAMPDYQCLWQEPPLDIDVIAVELALQGQRVTLNRDEQVEVIRRLTASGRTESQISALLGMNIGKIRRLAGAA